MDHPQSHAARERALSVLRLLRPHRVEGLGKVRLGRAHDGGYVMLDRFERVEAAYSFGINTDVSWDLDVAARGIPVFQYDHTIERLPAGHPLFHWERVGLAREPGPVGPTDSLANLVARNGHAGLGDMILKCDIEGDEWGVLPHAPTVLLAQFSQIVVELHDLARLYDPDVAETARKAVLNLIAAHRVVHVHANNWRPWTVIGGIPIPDVIEVTFARLDQGRFAVSDETFPTAIDMPNKPDQADLYLGRFVFD